MLRVRFSYEEAELINIALESSSPSPTRQEVITRLNNTSSDSQELSSLLLGAANKLESISDSSFAKFLQSLPLDSYTLYPVL